MASWLKTVGKIALEVGKVAPVVGPIVKVIAPSTAPGVQAVVNHADDLVQVAQIVLQAEAMGQAIQAPGAQKLQMAAPLVAQMLLSSSLLAGKTIADPVKFQFGCQQLAAGMADILNSLEAPATTVPPPTSGSST